MASTQKPKTIPIISIAIGLEYAVISQNKRLVSENIRFEVGMLRAESGKLQK